MMSAVVSKKMAFAALTSAICLSCLLWVRVEGQYQMPVPYQQMYQQPYQQFNPYQSPYHGYASIRPYVYPQPGYQMPYYPSSGYQQTLSQVPIGRLPEGYRVEPLSPGEYDENAIINNPWNVQNLRPMTSSVLPGYNPIQYGSHYVPTIQAQPEVPEQAQPAISAQDTSNQPNLMQLPLKPMEKPRYSIDIVTSKPPEYTVHEDSWSTKYTNNNNSYVFRKVENKPYNSTIRRVFTTNGNKSGSKVYTINIVNGVEVTTTEDPNSIISIDNQDTDGIVVNNVADELEENNGEEEDAKEEIENKPDPIFNWFS